MVLDTEMTLASDPQGASREFWASPAAVMPVPD